MTSRVKHVLLYTHVPGVPPHAAPWSCRGGAKFNLSSAKAIRRRLGWTSAEAAGMAIATGLVKVSEMRQGVIKHAIRFTSPTVQAAYQYPASHLVRLPAADVPANAPWMGMRVRLSAAYDCNTRLKTRAGRIVCTALKR
jgi:hypothetical protein